jgi:hypothetical protein
MERMTEENETRMETGVIVALQNPFLSVAFPPCLEEKKMDLHTKKPGSHKVLSSFSADRINTRFLPSLHTKNRFPSRVPFF